MAIRSSAAGTSGRAAVAAARAGSQRPWWRDLLVPVLAGTVVVIGIAMCMWLVYASETEHDTAVSVARLQADVLYLAAIENGIEADETTLDLSDLLAVEERVRSNLRSLVPRLPSGVAGTLAGDTMAYITAVDVNVTGVLAGDGTIDTDEFDTVVTDARLDTLLDQLDTLVTRSDTVAHASAVRARVGLTVVLVILSLGIAGVLNAETRRQRRRGATREAEHLSARFRAIVENMREYVLVTDEHGHVHYASPSVESMINSDGSAITHIGDALAGLSSESRDELTQLLGSDTPEPVQVELTGAAGETLHVELMVSDQRANANVGAFVVTVRDVTTQVQLEQRLRLQAATDELTGLPNRRALDEVSADAMARAVREHSKVGLVMIDVDGFKGVNDGLGHAAGDDLLVQLADRLRAVCRGSEVVARLGGDEFAVLLEGVLDAKQAAAAARRMRSVVDEPYELSGDLIAVHASFGVAVAEASAGFDGLFRRADTALYEAKDRGRNRVVVYEPGMDGPMETELRLRRQMVAGFASGEFSLAYQPLFDVRSGRPTGVEALMRWNSPALGPVPPAEFIPVAERSGMILALGRWGLHTACAQLVAWQREHGLAGLTMAVNVSVAQIQDDSFVDVVEEVIEATGIAPSALVLEVTESVLIARSGHVTAVLDSLRALGIRIALDDFGSGYSSMSQLQHLPVDELKIDGGFIRALSDGTRTSRAVVQTLFALGRSMGLRTIAEGVEEADQLQELTTQECDGAQGFLFARPMPAADVVAVLRGRAGPGRHVLEGITARPGDGPQRALPES